MSITRECLYIDSLLRLLHVCDLIINGAEFNQDREIESDYCGVEVLRYGSCFMFGLI